MRHAYHYLLINCKPRLLKWPTPRSKIWGMKRLTSNSVTLSFKYLISIPDWPIDEELVGTVTAVLQAQERLSFLMRTKLQENPSAKTGNHSTQNAYLKSLLNLI